MSALRCKCRRLLPRDWTSRDGICASAAFTPRASSPSGSLRGCAQWRGSLSSIASPRTPRAKCTRSSRANLEQKGTPLRISPSPKARMSHFELKIANGPESRMGRSFTGSGRGEKRPASCRVKRGSGSASRFDEARKVPVNAGDDRRGSARTAAAALSERPCRSRGYAACIDWKISDERRATPKRAASLDLSKIGYEWGYKCR